MTCVGCVCVCWNSQVDCSFRGKIFSLDIIIITIIRFETANYHSLSTSFPVESTFLPLAHLFLRFALELRSSGLIVIEGVRCKLANDQFRQFEMDDRQEVKSEKMKSNRNGKRCEKERGEIGSFKALPSLCLLPSVTDKLCFSYLFPSFHVSLPFIQVNSEGNCNQYNSHLKWMKKDRMEFYPLWVSVAEKRRKLPTFSFAFFSLLFLVHRLNFLCVSCRLPLCLRLLQSSPRNSQLFSFLFLSVVSQHEKGTERRLKREKKAERRDALSHLTWIIYFVFIYVVNKFSVRSFPWFWWWF